MRSRFDEFLVTDFLALAMRSRASTAIGAKLRVLSGGHESHGSTPGKSGLRQPPKGKLFLRSHSLSVTLDAEDGLPYRFDLSDAFIWGEDVGAPIMAVLCRMQPRAYETIPLKAASLTRTTSNVVFHFSVPWQQQEAARFSLRYAIDGASLVLTMEDVVEYSGFEFIEVALPSLATVRESDSGAWMAQGRDGGSFVRIAEAKLAYRFRRG